jgi:hypothetical protein
VPLIVTDVYLEVGYPSRNFPSIAESTQATLEERIGLSSTENAGIA